MMMRTVVMMVVMIRMMMMMMMMMMMLRRMMRRKTEPKTGQHTLCELAQATCTWTCHESHFVEIYRKNAGRQSRDTLFVRACAVDMHMDISQEPFCVEIYRESARSPGDYHLDQRRLSR